MKNKLLAVLVSAFLAVPIAAQAGLLGATVASQYYAYGGTYSGYGSPATFVADGSVQQTFCSICDEGFTLVVSDNQVTYTFLTNGYWSPSGTSLDADGLYIANGNLLTFSGISITSVSVNAGTTMPGFGADDMTFNSQNIAVDWAGFSGISQGDVVILDVVTGGSVPAPGVLALFALGLACLGLARRRKQ